MTPGQEPVSDDRRSEHEEAERRRRAVMNGNIAMALMHLANAQKDLANAVRISPMRDIIPAVDAGLEHALDEIASARTKIKTAIGEAHGVAMLEEAVRNA